MDANETGLHAGLHQCCGRPGCIPFGDSLAWHFGIGDDAPPSPDSVTGGMHLRREMPRILIVEDEATIALSIQLHLEDAGYDVVAIVADGPGALRALEDAELSGGLPDLVLMDITLRGAMDGIETARQAQARFPTLRVVFLTGQADPRTRERAAATNPAAYLLKPCTPDQVEQVLSAVLQVRN